MTNGMKKKWSVCVLDVPTLFFFFFNFIRQLFFFFFFLVSISFIVLAFGPESARNLPNRISIFFLQFNLIWAQINEEHGLS